MMTIASSEMKMTKKTTNYNFANVQESGHGGKFSSVLYFNIDFDTMA